MDLNFFKEHKIISIIIILLLIIVCRMCMYERIVKNNKVYVINKITNTYHIQHSDDYIRQEKKDKENQREFSEEESDWSDKQFKKMVDEQHGIYDSNY